MAQPSPPPRLTPQLCFNERALRDFLRLSRHSVDDVISTHLNSLVTPSTTNPFTAGIPRPDTVGPVSSSSPSSSSSSSSSSFSTSSAFSTTSPSRQHIPEPSCNSFKSTILFPAWSARTDVLEYCSHVATSPDPDDPTIPLRQQHSEADRTRVVNERLDPYSGRSFPPEPRTGRLATLLRNEMAVERIVRRRTWAVVGDRCGDVNEVEGVVDGTEGWERALDKWREGGQGKRGKRL